MRALGWLAVGLLTACASTPPRVETVTVTVEKTVPVPAKLTADCYDEPAQRQDDHEAKRLANLRRASLAECTKRMREIRALGR